MSGTVCVREFFWELLVVFIPNITNLILFLWLTLVYNFGGRQEQRPGKRKEVSFCDRFYGGPEASYDASCIFSNKWSYKPLLSGPALNELKPEKLIESAGYGRYRVVSEKDPSISVKNIPPKVIHNLQLKFRDFFLPHSKKTLPFKNLSVKENSIQAIMPNSTSRLFRPEDFQSIERCLEAALKHVREEHCDVNQDDRTLRLIRIITNENGVFGFRFYLNGIDHQRAWT